VIQTKPLASRGPQVIWLKNRLVFRFISVRYSGCITEFLRLQFVAWLMFSIRVRLCRICRSARIDLACPYHTATPARPQRPTVGGSRSSKFKSPPLYTPKEGSFPFLFNREFFYFLSFFLSFFISPSVSQDAKRSVKLKKDAVKSLAEICVDSQVDTHI
jgi:hypothetical protein